MGVASGCGEQEVGVVTGSGCKEVYRFPHITCPYSFCICFFSAASLLFANFLKCFRSCSYDEIEPV